jgi:hypothetical protein
LALSAKERSLRGRAGAYAQQAANDTRETTKAARAAWFEKRFLDEVDPNRELSEIERLRRAKAAMRSYMAKLALKSAQKRRARKSA